MAIYRLAIAPIGRSTARHAVDVAAYRSGERLVNGRSGAVYDHSERRDVAHREVVLPSRLRADEAAWARDRQQLWNAAEAAEVRRNARFAREYQVALPHELDVAARRALTLKFATDLADRYGVAVDVAIHAPRGDGDDRNHHAHLLATTREVTRAGFGRKASAEWNEDTRRAAGLPSGREEFQLVRAHWAGLANGALREAGLAITIDHRSLAAQGIDRAPKNLPWHVYKAAQRALAERATERVRDFYRERAAAADTADPQLRSEPNPSAAPAAAPAAATTEATQRLSQHAATRARPSLEEIRRTAREAWGALREARRTEGRDGLGSATEAAVQTPDKTPEATARGSNTRDDDLAL